MKQIFTYLLGLTISLSAWSLNPAEIKTAAYLDSIKTNPAQLTTFLWAMPKGGDLHLHMSGSSYPENLIQYSHNENLCINPQTYTVSSDPNCDLNNYLKLAIENLGFYNKVIDAWSMRHFDTTYESGHDHFFATFSKFSLIGKKHRGEILAELSLRAALENESYLEIMTRPDGSDASSLGEEIGWYSAYLFS